MSTEIKQLPCLCHAVTTDGHFLSRVKQFSCKGKRGIRTVLTTSWERMLGTLTESGYAAAKLNEESVVSISIMRLRASGRTFISIARQFCVSKKLIMLVCQRKIWRHVNDNPSSD